MGKAAGLGVRSLRAGAVVAVGHPEDQQRVLMREALQNTGSAWGHCLGWKKTREDVPGPGEVRAGLHSHAGQTGPGERWGEGAG